MTWTRALAGLAIAGWIGSAAAAHAQESARMSATARALFDEGVACADHEDWPCAVERFGRARALRASPVIVSNHATALRHVGRWVEASEAFRAVARDPSANARLRADAAREAEDIEGHLGRLTIALIGDAEGVALTMDGGTLDASLVGVAMPADPGEHTVEARREGALLATAHARVGEGEEARVELRLPLHRAPQTASIETPVSATLGGGPTDADRISSAGALASTTAADHHEVYEEWWFWTVIGVVVVGAGIGVTLGVLESTQTSPPSGSLGTIDVRP